MVSPGSYIFPAIATSSVTSCVTARNASSYLSKRSATSAKPGSRFFATQLSPSRPTAQALIFSLVPWEINVYPVTVLSMFCALNQPSETIKLYSSPPDSSKSSISSPLAAIASVSKSNRFLVCDPAPPTLVFIKPGHVLAR